MNTSDYRAIADKYRQTSASDRAPVPTAAPLSTAMELLRHMQADNAAQQKEPVPAMKPITPVAN